MGKKVAQTAAAHGKEPKEFVDGLVDSFKELWHAYNIDYTRFIRTTDEYHVDAVQQWIRDLLEKGDIYKAAYEGWYCTASEMFLTDRDIAEWEGEVPLCPTTGKPATWVSEECYFFRLSAYQDRLIQFYQEHPDFITPRERMNEVVTFVESGLKDLSISRRTVKWGIPFPGEPEQVTYVWADALNNYITGIGYGQPDRAAEFEKWWPADLHIIGKDIVRFHAIFWPAFLMAAELPLPKKLLVHGFIRVNEQKMSKSLGNVIDPRDLLATYGADQIRYYLTRYIAVTQDSSFSLKDVEGKINSDLADSVGNLLRRIVTLAEKNDATHLDAPQQMQSTDQTIYDAYTAMLKAFDYEMAHYYFHRAYNHVWHFVHVLNRYIHEQEPWKVAKHDPARFRDILSVACHGLYAVAVLVWPVMPSKMQQLLTALGHELSLGTDIVAEQLEGDWMKRFVLTPGEPLFEKIQESVEEVLQAKTKQETPVEKVEKKPETEGIGIEELSQVELRAGLIRSVDDIAGADKLYKLTVDFGDYGERTICAGIKEHYRADEIAGQKTVFVYNMKPRKMRGIQSHGMLLVPKDVDGKPVLVDVPASVPLGTRLS